MTRVMRDLGPAVRFLMAGVIVSIATAPQARAQVDPGPLRLNPESALALALANNLDLEVARRGPEAAELNLRAAQGAWAPAVAATLGEVGVDSPANNSFDRVLGVLTDRQTSSAATLSQRLPWGASYEVGWSSLRRANNSLLNRFQPELNAAASARFTQPLLRGFAIDAARADRAQSVQEIDRAALDFESTLTALKREVSQSYWQWVSTRDLREVAKETLALAQALLDGNRERVAAGAMAATDVIEAEAEVARRGEAVIVAEKNVANAEDRLRRLILNARAPDYERELEPAESAGLDAPPDAVDPVARALAERSDLKRLRSVGETNSLNVRRLGNDALPDLNVSVGLSARAVGGTELIRESGIGTPVVVSIDRGFGTILGDLGQLRYPGWSMQMSFAYPVGAAVAKANAARAQVEKRQTDLAVSALEQRIATEVRTAQREVDAAVKRLESTATALALAERRLAGEEEKFLVGLSTSFFVFQAQRDLASARVARLGAVLDHRLAIADLEAVQVAPLVAIR